MSVAFDHTIVHVRDREAAASWLADLFGLAPPQSFGPFAAVRFDNGAVLDFADSIAAPHRGHYAFLVSEEEFDRIHGELVARGVRYCADPFGEQEGQISTDNGRALYFDDLDGNALELLTVPDLGWPS